MPLRPPISMLTAQNIRFRGFQERLFSSLDQNTSFPCNIEIGGRGAEASNVNRTFLQRLFSSLDPDHFSNAKWCP